MSATVGLFESAHSFLSSFPLPGCLAAAKAWSRVIDEDS
jgi:hypothetical protein